MYLLGKLSTENLYFTREGTNRRRRTERGPGGAARPSGTRALSQACSPGSAGSRRPGEHEGPGPARAAARLTEPERPPSGPPEKPRRCKGSRGRRREGLKGRRRRRGGGGGSVPARGALLWILMVSRLMAAARHLHAGSAPGAVRDGPEHKAPRPTRPGRRAAASRGPVPAPPSLPAGRGRSSDV